MLIGELAKITNTTRDTIRYYERLGLLATASRPNRFNNYKDYPDGNIARIEQIRMLRSLGFRMKEIVGIFKSVKTGKVDCHEARRLLEQKAGEVKEQMRDLENQHARIQKLIRDFKIPAATQRAS